MKSKAGRKPGLLLSHGRWAPIAYRVQRSHFLASEHTSDAPVASETLDVQIGNANYKTTVVIVLYAVLLAIVPAAESVGSEEISSFEFVDRSQIPNTVWYYIPAATEANTRVVFLLHGDSRTGHEARDLGAPHARDGRFIQVAPEFDEKHFPGDSCSFGGMVDATHRLRPRNDWTLLIIEELFDHIRTRWKLETTTYDAIGHSGGAQFLHRLVLFVPEARFDHAIASSPGRYAFPTPRSACPLWNGWHRCHFAPEAGFRSRLRSTACGP